MDKLSEILTRFSVSAGVFYSGNLCGLSRFDNKESNEGHLHLLQSGRLQVIDERGDPVWINEPSLLFYPKPTQHRLMADETDKARLVCATIRYGSGANNPLANALPAAIMISFASSPQLSDITRLLFEEAFGERDGRQALMDRLMEVFLIQLLRHVMEDGLVKKGMLAGLSHSQISKVMMALHANPAEPWNLEKMADLASMSRSKFAETFHRVVGQPPGDYLIEWRIGIAQSLLKKGKPVGWVANETGYENASTLARVFRAKTGLSPKQWKKSSEL